MKVIRIPRSHTDDFDRHPGWWAQIDNPDLAAGEEFVFEFHNGGDQPFRTERARATYVGPGEGQWSTWTLIRYEPLPMPAAQHTST